MTKKECDTLNLFLNTPSLVMEKVLKQVGDRQSFTTYIGVTMGIMLSTVEKMGEIAPETKNIVQKYMEYYNKV